MLGWAGLRVRMEDQERERERQRMVVGVDHRRLGIVASRRPTRSSCWSYTVPSFRTYNVLVFRTHLF